MNSPLTPRRLAIALALAAALALRATWALPMQPPPPGPRIVKIRTIPVALRSSLIVQASALKNGNFMVLAERADGPDSAELAILDRSGKLLRALASPLDAQGIARLAAFSVDSTGQIWAITSYPPELVRFDPQGNLLSAFRLPALRVAYGVIADSDRRRIVVSGCVKYRDLGPGCQFLVQEFSLPTLAPTRSLVPVDPSVLVNHQLTIQTVPLAMDPEGRIWGTDSPAFSLFAVPPNSGSVAQIPVVSHKAPHAIPFNQQAGPSYATHYILTTGLPLTVVSDQLGVQVGVKLGDHFWVESFNATGTQTGIDVAAPGMLVGRGHADSLLFDPRHSPAALIEARLSR